jgi:hypothetical protein
MENNKTIALGEEDYAIVFKEDGTIIPYTPDHEVYLSVGEYHFGMTLELFLDTKETVKMQCYLANKVKDNLIRIGAYGTEKKEK